MQLVYFIDILEDDHKKRLGGFVTGSVNVMKTLQNKNKNFSVYINLAQSHQKAMEIFTTNTNTQNFRMSSWFVTNC